MTVILGDNFPGGNYPGGHLPGGDYPGGNRPGGNFPVTVFMLYLGVFMKGMFTSVSAPLHIETEIGKFRKRFQTESGKFSVLTP